MKKKLISADYELDRNGELIPVYAEGWVSYFVEIYGSDADGNRGSRRTFVEDVSSVQVFFKDDGGCPACNGSGEEVTLTKAEETEAADKLTTAFLEKGE